MNAEQLDQHLRETPWFIEQHRARISPTNYAYSDEIMTPGGFGPKSPGNDNAIMFADQEAATIGRLASYCMNTGSIPRFPLKGLWWSRGRCLGLSVDGLEGFRKSVDRVRLHVGDILATEGVEEYLEDMAEMRSISLGMFPNEDDNWLTMEEAIDFTGRSDKTIYKWLSAGGIHTLDDRWGLMMSKEDLRTKMAIVYANMISVMSNARRKNKKNTQSPS